MWSHIPPDPIFAVLDAYMQDSRSDKINASLGVLLRDQKPYVMPSIQKAASEVQHDNYGYLPLGGDRGFLEWVRDTYLPNMEMDRIALQQTAGGTQACWMVGQLARRFYWGDFLIPTPTWGNYFSLLQENSCVSFDHLDAEGNIAWDAYEQALMSAPRNSVLVLQATAAHNPTGKNVHQSQRNEIVRIANEHGLWIYLDGAYIGLAEGMEADIKWITDIWNQAQNVMLGVSFSKTATLYGHRLGALMVKCPNSQQKIAMESHMQAVIRGNISMAPKWGSMVMNIVRDKYEEAWKADVNRACNELMMTRENISRMVKDAGNTQLLSTLDGAGMFALLPLSEGQVQNLRKEKGIYLCDNGRVNISGFVGRDALIWNID